MDRQIEIDALVKKIREYAINRRGDVIRGAETPRLAAILVQKYGEGIIDAAITFFDNPRVADPLQNILDEEVFDIDPDWQKNAKERWEGRPADISIRRK